MDNFLHESSQLPFSFYVVLVGSLLASVVASRRGSSPEQPVAYKWWVLEAFVFSFTLGLSVMSISLGFALWSCCNVWILLQTAICHAWLSKAPKNDDNRPPEGGWEEGVPDDDGGGDGLPLPELTAPWNWHAFEREAYEEWQRSREREYELV